MGGWQDELWRKAQKEADDAKGTPEYEKLQREANARKAEVNESRRRAGQKPIS